MSDLIERLRAWHTPNETITGDVQLYLDAADRIEALEAALRERDELIRLMRRSGSRQPNPQPNLRGSAAPDADRIEALEAALRFALEVMENYSKLDGRDPSYATPSSAIGVARATLAEGQAK